jgi:hypothetical protein
MGEAQARFQRNPDFIFRRVVDELVLVPVHQDVADMDCIYSLNGVGAFVWEQLDQPASIDDLQTAVLADYEADPDAVAADVERFLAELTAFGAVSKV